MYVPSDDIVTVPCEGGVVGVVFIIRLSPSGSKSFVKRFPDTGLSCSVTPVSSFATTLLLMDGSRSGITLIVIVAVAQALSGAGTSSHTV